MPQLEQTIRSLPLGRAARVLVAVTWVGLLASFAGSEPGGTFFAAAAASTLLAGLTIGRRWVLLVPTVLSSVYALWALVSPVDGSELTRGGQVLLPLVAGVLVVGLLEVGITARRLGPLLARRARAA